MNTPEWPDAGERRSEERRHLLFATTAKSPDGESQPVLVRDISARGLLLETEEAGSLDKTIMVNLPETGDIEAHVIWQGDKLAGCRLETHLSQATIDAVRATGEAAHAEQPSNDAPVPRTAARTLAARLKQLRMAKDLTRAELAERSGISTPSIWAWETGRTVPRLGSLETLAKGLGVDVSELQIGVAGASGDLHPAVMPKVAPGEGGGDLRTARLSELVAASKAQIAALAGTTSDKVSITIAL
jgi:transcriptional regulator with XRE-family HTH domain